MDKVEAFTKQAQELGIDMSTEALRSLGEWLAPRTAWPSDSHRMARDADAVFEAHVGPGDQDDTEELRVVCDGAELEWFDKELNGWTILWDGQPHPDLPEFVDQLNRVLRRG